MVRAVMIVEIAGNPAEHVKTTLQNHVGVLDKLSYVTTHSTKVSEPKELENSQGMFTCFAEVDFEVKTLSELTGVLFDFMPSSIEIIEPSKLSLDAIEATTLLNNISGRLHRYDEVARVAQERYKQLEAYIQKAQEKAKQLTQNSHSENKKVTKKKATKKKAVKKKATKKKTKK